MAKKQRGPRHGASSKQNTLKDLFHSSAINSKTLEIYHKNFTLISHFLRDGFKV